jgi:hypothetical protein
MSLLEDLIKTPDFKEVWGGDPDDKKARPTSFLIQKD